LSMFLTCGMFSGGMLKPMTTGKIGVEAEVWSWVGRMSMGRCWEALIRRLFFRGEGMRLDGGGAALAGRSDHCVPPLHSQRRYKRVV